MKTIYQQWVVNSRWLCLLWALGLSLSLKAQPTLNPVIQWQQVIEGGIDASSQVKLNRTSLGNFGVLNGTALSFITPTGALKSIAAVEGSVQINTSPIEYSRVLRTFDLAPTNDGGFVVLASDATNLYIIKKDVNQNRVWSSILGNVQEYATGLNILATPDGGFMAFAIHSSAGNLANVTAAKFTSAGTLVWRKDVFSQEPSSGIGTLSRSFTKVVPSSDGGGGFLIMGNQFSPLARPRPNPALIAKTDLQANLTLFRTFTDIVAFSDGVPHPDITGGFILLGITDPGFGGSYNGPTYPFQMQADGSVVRLGRFTLNGRSRIAMDGSDQPHYLTVEGYGANGGDFIVTFFNRQNEGIGSKILGGSMADIPQAVIPTGDGFLLGGTTTSSDGDVKGKQGNALATWVVKLSKTATSLIMSQPIYNCLTGVITFNVTGGDGSPITYTAPGITRASVFDNFGTVEQELRNDPKPITITAQQGSSTVSYTFDFKSVCSTTTGELNLFLGSYNCQTGALVFATTGGDGSPITYTAPGITRASLSDNFGTVEQELRNDPKPITITARQSGKSVDFTFDFGAYCRSLPPVNPPTAGSLALIAPTYNCATGAFTFNTFGGDGSPIEYQSPGITGWTTNPSHFVDTESRTANDVQPFTLMARQSGVSVTYVWNLKAACGRARVAALPEAGTSLRVRVLGNPVAGPTAELEVTGAESQSLLLNLVDQQGRVLHQQRIEQAESVQRVRVPMGVQAGVFLLNVSTAGQRQQVKLLKP